MQRLPPVLRSLALAALVWPALVAAGPSDLVYRTTRHGDGAVGVNRVAGLMRGNCNHCHDLRGTTTAAQLWTANDNGLCFTCHTNPVGVFLGRATFEATLHWTSGQMRWPGPVPAARPVGDQGECLNCHTPHGNRDARGLVPDLGHTREESLCTACHDSTGPSTVNILAELTKAATHPITSAALAGRHVAGEAGAAPFATANRHVECADCHNPHAAQAGPAAPATTSKTLLAVSRVQVTNGAANTAPAYALLPASDTSPPYEWQVCLKCHSGFVGALPAGARDKGLELNPANASFHPVEAAGRNATAAMTQSLLGGTGNPKLTPTSTLWCSDCHSSEAIPTTVSTLAAYTGTAPGGPHGSSASAGNATYSTALLRAAYRTALYGNTNYAAADFALCYTCHAAAPFNDTSKNTRADTNFRLHGFHVRGERAICKECHESIHGTATASQAGNRAYGRLVSFWPTFTAPGGGPPTWSQAGRSCTVTCHGMNHNSENY